MARRGSRAVRPVAAWWWEQALRPLPRRLSPTQLFVLSFLGLVGVGTLGFLWIPGLTPAEPLGAQDALFTATSAVCVTGLSVIDVSSALTWRGQLWLLLLIQAGGLGILTFAALVLGFVGRRGGLAMEEAAGGPGTLLVGSPGQLLRAALAVTLVLEAAGTLALFALWADRMAPGAAAWAALFHAVSAFCNAGFSTFRDSLIGVRQEPAELVTLALLVVLGGVGFPVIQDARLRLRGRRVRLTLHSRLVLAATGALLLVSTGLYLLFEAGRTLAPLAAGDRVWNALFMAVTPRTAGFNTVDYDALSNPSLLLTLVLMWIGGGPASVAGGVKVTTAALLGLVLLSRLRGEGRVSLAGRTVPEETIHRATGLAVGAVVLLCAFVFALLATELPPGHAGGERRQFLRIVFEAQSAFSTVGLSMGLTPELTPAGRLLLVPLMLLGRVGPLAVLGAMALRQQRRAALRFAHEDVLVG